MIGVSELSKGRHFLNGWVRWLKCLIKTIGYLTFVCLHCYLFHGPKNRWRDVLKGDFIALDIKDGFWDQKTLHRSRYMVPVYMIDSPVR